MILIISVVTTTIAPLTGMCSFITISLQIVVKKGMIFILRFKVLLPSIPE